MRSLAALLLLASTAACTTMTPDAPPQTMVAPILTSTDARDTATYARPEVARVTHVDLDLALDFAAKTVGGTATLDLLTAPGATEVVLDDRGLQISRVTDGGGAELPFTVGQSVEGRGAPLTIAIGPGAERRRIAIQYTAAPGAEALQWLAPEQTAGKAQPFLFSQGQAILNRTWIPTQDSPGIRQTWRARITAPKPLTVVMSGLKQGETEDLGDRRAFTYAMNKPVAPYLIAIAAGDIAFREIGPRTGVWAEPATLAAAHHETADTEKMVVAAEKLYGPYRWGRYDMIVLPPSFPYGGMENPTLTFLTPTFIAGDRSLNGLIAHELAHSWSGNLVTNANWSDSWLNEGVTSYFENRIIEALYGPRRASQEAALSFAEMEGELAKAGPDNPETALHLPDSVAGPDAGLGGVIYDKGAVFMRTVETIVGRPRFDAWLRQWFDNHAFQPATSAMILADMKANLVGNDPALAQRLMLDEWIYQPGLPANAVRPNPAAFAEVDAAAAAYGTGGGVPQAAWAKWTTAERLRFMAKLPRERTAAQLGALDQALGLSNEGNDEVLFAWLQLALANRYEPAVPLAEQFLARVGRRKFVAPLFETLMGEGEWGQPLARRIYATTRPGYHAVTTVTVDKLVLKKD
ncbi:M1 family metallopeptidase [Altererythrobacter sp. TH136]|uniref:M1 family metallopeptidase n=1 Tax=Altererythrobacter sp. TH136 TaxID=2067415 RepID=UPI0011630EB3|nr:M1 family metallopeptidase [Altererythrobacter sp. TH136]QDM41796.1 M1 family metallopeptidase [Altererythrobacter sp. TH136]